jgi:hypothetical protein
MGQVENYIDNSTCHYLPEYARRWGRSGVVNAFGIPRRSRLRNKGKNLCPNNGPSAQLDNLSEYNDENDN